MARGYEAAPGSLLDRIESEVLNLTERDGGIWAGDVPLDLVDATDVPVNARNLEIITFQLEDEAREKGSDGQISPIQLGYVEEHDLLDIIDGFHRFDIFQEQGRSHIFALMIDVTLEELYDKRIQNTNNHSGLQFARAVEWVNQVWELHPMAERISAVQAFTLGRTRSSTGGRLGLSAPEVKRVMSWVDKKSALWGLGPMTIYQYLLTDSNVAPDLVAQSRTDRDQATGPNSLPPSTLARIARQIPDRRRVQRTVARVITKHNLSGVATGGILSDVSRLSDTEALGYLRSLDVQKYKANIAEKPVYKYTQDDILNLERTRTGTSRVRPLREIVALTSASIEMALEEGDYDPTKMQDVQTELGRIGTQMVKIADEISDALEETEGNASSRKEQTRPFKEFSSGLAEFLLDPTKRIDIRTQREAQAALRAVQRGRGTQKSLEALQRTLTRYYDSKK